MFVLFGRGAGASGETWTWDGARWTPARPATAPSARLGETMTYDAIRREVVLFGGTGVDGVPLSDTWTWDGAAWREERPAVSPPARSGAGMTFDAKRGLTLLFGGEGARARVGEPLNDLWSWDGTGWTQVDSGPGPSPRFGLTLAYDAERAERCSSEEVRACPSLTRGRGTGCAGAR